MRIYLILSKTPNHPIDHPPINEFITFPPFRGGNGGGDPLIGCVGGGGSEWVGVRVDISF